MAKTTKKSRDAYSEQLDSILEQLENGVAPWVKPWQTLGNQRNGKTGRVYSGSNALYLISIMTNKGYTTPLWVTTKQAKALGGHVKGRKMVNGVETQADEYDNSYLVVWFRPATSAKLDSDGEPVLDENGEVVERTSWIRGVQFVYNVEQTTIDPKKYAKLLPDVTQPNTNERNEEVEAALEAIHTDCGFELRFGGDRACYSSMQDRVSIPEMSRFVDTENFYATQMHEFAHASGHKSRLNRPLNNVVGSKAYAEEELVAEMTAAFLGAEYQMDGKCQHPEYINSWFTALQKDKRIFHRAASKAKKAADFLKKSAERGAKKGTEEKKAA